MQLLNFIYSMMDLLICKYEPFWQDSDTQVTVKACGPFVNNQDWVVSPCTKNRKKIKIEKDLCKKNILWWIHNLSEWVFMVGFVNIW